MSQPPTTTGLPSAAFRGWLRVALYLAPFGALVLGIAAGGLLTPVIGPEISRWIPLSLFCIVTIAGGFADSMLKWKELRGSGFPQHSKLATDILCFGLAQILIVPGVGSLMILVGLFQ